MPTYAETVLADNPLFFFRLDELSVGANMPDSSGNGNHGTYFSDAGFGVGSPIETDAGSKAIGARAGSKSAASGSDLDVRTAFSWECWILWPGHSVVNSTGFGRNGQWGSNGGNMMGTAGDNLAAMVAWGTSAGNTRTLVYPLSEAAQLTTAWYHLFVTRSQNVIRFYVNGFLRDEKTDFDVNPIVYANYNSGDYVIGGAPANSQVFESFGTDEVALYDSALGADRVLAHYESALASLPLSVTINVRVVVELDTDQVDSVDFPFAHNFAEPLSGNSRPIVEHLSYKTNVLQSEPDYQQRINAQPHHVERTLEYFVTPTSSRARAMMQAALWTPGQTYKLPIAKDWGGLTAQGTAGANTLSLDTLLRDYEVGSYVVVWEDVYRPWTAQFFQITSRTDSQLGITPNIGATLPAGSTVMPARLAILPEDSLSIDSHLIDRETAALQFEILSTELSSRRVTAYTPDEEYLDIEVFKLERAKVEWVDPAPYQISRRQQGIGTSTGNDFLRAIDTGSPQTIPVRVLLASRAAQAEFYGWMDARQGKQNPVWIVSEENDFTVVGRTSTTITIENIGYTTRYNVHSARRHIAILQTNGDVQYNLITDAEDNGDTEGLTLENGPPLLANISKVSFLRLCTAPDQFELRYHRDGSDFVAECELVFSELLTTPE